MSQGSNIKYCQLDFFSKKKYKSMGVITELCSKVFAEISIKVDIRNPSSKEYMSRYSNKIYLVKMNEVSPKQ